MLIKYICPFWGSEKLGAKEFVIKALDSGYDGDEMNVPDNPSFVLELKVILAKTSCDFIAQQWLPPASETVDEYRKRMFANLYRLVEFNPLFINSHTGKDYFSFEKNSSLLESCFQFTKDTGINIVHETHRGSFNFHAFTTLPYLQKFEYLQLNADFSHFCSVSESMLEDQEIIMEKILPRCFYTHARVGFDQSAQVNHPFAPEWKNELNQFVSWWQKIVDIAKKRGDKEFFICPEFGPFPYIQQLPYTKENVTNQWQVNLDMMKFLKENLNNKYTKV